MNDLGTPSPDWASIFDRAHRRIFARVALIGGVGALCALLLLSGGLTARGDVPWRNGSKEKTEGKKEAHEERPQREDRMPAQAPDRDAETRKADETTKKPKEEDGESSVQAGACAGDPDSSANMQYCDPGDAGSSTGGTGAPEDIAGNSEVAGGTTGDEQ